MKRILLLSILFCIFILAGCKKKDDPSPSSSNNKDTNPTSSADYYLVFYDGKKAVKLEQDVNDIYNGYVSSGSNMYLTMGGAFTTFDEDYDVITKASIGYGKNYGTYYPNSSTTYNAYSTGSNSWGNENTEAEGFILGYVDGNGVWWSTDKGDATQSGSSINITSKSAYNGSAMSYTVAGTFNCTVYDGNGNSKTLTNGKFKTMFAYD